MIIDYFNFKPIRFNVNLFSAFFFRIHIEMRKEKENMSTTDEAFSAPKQRLLYNYETYIWLLLVIVLLVRDPWNHTAYICIAHFAIRWLNEEKLNGKLPLPSTNDPKLFRAATTTADGDGVAAAIVLVPVMLEAMLTTLHKNKFATYAQTISLVLFSWGHWDATLLIPTVYAERVSNGEPANILLFLTCWISTYSVIHTTPFLQKVFTWGEWMIVTSLFSIGGTELTLKRIVNSQAVLSDLVAMAGIVGSVLAFSFARWASKSVWVRSVIIAIVPFLTIEVALRKYAFKFLKDYPSQKTLPWFLDYLKGKEDALFTNKLIPTGFSTIFWVIYNGLVLAVMLPLSSRYIADVTVSRKWFHLVAVLLFLPTTLSAPAFQMLSYAVGTSLLILLEVVREHIKPVSRFFEKYLDATKGETETSTMVISHLALLLGCAAPLWISRVLYNVKKPHIMQVLVGVWGVISIGVGDAVGAVVGKLVGKKPWGHQRTAEGSLAMAGSMLVSYAAIALTLSEHLEWSVVVALIAAIVFTTLLEAYTTQNDNLVLPMAGLTMMLLVQRIVAGPEPTPVRHHGGSNPGHGRPSIFSQNVAN
jgi:dolichol kinase